MIISRSATSWRITGVRQSVSAWASRSSTVSRSATASFRPYKHPQPRVDDGDTKKALYKEIQQAYYNATASQEKYIASDKSVLASKEAFSYAEDRYAAGKSTVFEYSEAKTKYAQSLSEQAQAKYNFIFRAKILDFYNGTPITL